MTEHACAVAVEGRGLLILGASGSGKSGLALRMIALGARLVADDRVELERRGADLIARAPAALSGMIEARGIGVLRADPLPEVAIELAVDLDCEPAARMPHHGTITRSGVEIELISGLGVPNLASALTLLLRTGDSSKAGAK